MKWNAVNKQSERDTDIRTRIINMLFLPVCSKMRKLIAVKSVMFCLALFSSQLYAITMDITAEFSADISKPQLNEFVNTTPVTGFCANYWNDCASFGGFSVVIPNLTAERVLDSNNTSDYMDYQPSMAVDGAPKIITLTDPMTNRSINVNFRLVLVGVTYTRLNGSSGTLGMAMNVMSIPGNGCKKLGGSTLNSDAASFAWQYPESKADCFAFLNYRYPFAGLVRISDVSIGYTLQLPDPLNVYAGTYEGEITYVVGNGRDIDLHAQSTSETELIIKLKATVKHAFNIFFPGGSDDLNVKLDARGGWSQWINGKHMPELLQKEMPFLLTSSTPFVVKMQCGAGLDGGNQNCALQNAQTNEIVPLDVFLTFPGFKSNGTDVNNLRMTTEVNGQAIDPPSAIIADRRSHLDFRVSRPGVETMVKAPGSTWKGAVTLIFDTQTQ
ncbi:hypothetical protein Y71_07360 [Kosakonia radicincitans DSM 16656]|uniref:hypothetical protein n=1 Tax=Kosakonia radicincitans TaxID=283686 RepID=UPI0002ED2AD3|nr:hypothetical protein [Kosakonia radicincitans]ARD59739.1 hypothetical protein Y71_07360 [Kosakonia radicincitans DSM 16656]